MSNVYTKLLELRAKVVESGLKGTGNNKFAGYTYLELADFLPKVNLWSKEIGIIGIVTFFQDIATLTIINTENQEEKIVFNTPMSTAQLKGCHDVQNLGAVQTYLRRYLWTAALELVEADALNLTQGKPEEDKPKTKKYNKDEFIKYLLGNEKILINVINHYQTESIYNLTDQQLEETFSTLQQSKKGVK